MAVLPIVILADPPGPGLAADRAVARRGVGPAPRIRAHLVLARDHRAGAVDRAQPEAHAMNVGPRAKLAAHRGRLRAAHRGVGAGLPVRPARRPRPTTASCCCRPRWSPGSASKARRDGRFSLRGARGALGPGRVRFRGVPAGVRRQAPHPAPGAPRPRARRVAGRARLRGGRPGAARARARSRRSRAPWWRSRRGASPSPPGAGNDRAHIYLVDPHGNVMMRWPERPDRARMLKDLQRLLQCVTDRLSVYNWRFPCCSRR